jgi:hypothetical protein
MGTAGSSVRFGNILSSTAVSYEDCGRIEGARETPGEGGGGAWRVPRFPASPRVTCYSIMPAVPTKRAGNCAGRSGTNAGSEWSGDSGLIHLTVSLQLGERKGKVLCVARATCPHLKMTHDQSRHAPHRKSTP